MSAAAADRPVLGILLMLGFCVAIPVADASAKWIGTALPLGELLLFRFAAQAVLLAPVAGRRMAMRGRVLALMVLRAGLQILGVAMMYLALRVLPLADAVAIAFVMPFMMLGLGWAFAGEEVGPHRLAACAVGFLGTLLVVQPNFVAVGAAALLPMAVALVFSLFMLVTRAIAKEADPIAVQAVTGGLGVTMLLPVLAAMAWAGHVEAQMVWPDRALVLPLAGICVVGTLAHLLMTWSLRFAPSATLAPMQYLEIPAAALVGFLLFEAWPNAMAQAGIGVTVAAGLYILWREQVRSRQAR